jgi:hypothetical protein
MPATKATPKGEITLVSRDDAGAWKFAHSPSGMGNFSLKQKLGKKVTLGVGFTVRRHRDCWRQCWGRVSCSSGSGSSMRPGLAGRAATVAATRRGAAQPRAASKVALVAARTCSWLALLLLQDTTVRKIKSIPGLVLSGDLKVRGPRGACRVVEQARSLDASAHVSTANCAGHSCRPLIAAATPPAANPAHACVGC